MTAALEGGLVVSSTPRAHFTPRKYPVPISQEAGWAPGPVWTGGKSRLHRDSITDRPVRSQSLYRMGYRVHVLLVLNSKSKYRSEYFWHDKYSEYKFLVLQLPSYKAHFPISTAKDIDEEQVRKWYEKGEGMKSDFLEKKKRFHFVVLQRYKPSSPFHRIIFCNAVNR